ncbi:MAG TPA: NAD(P)-dependent alcohol dehydrogenase [Acidimicrobiales bacterium]|jgi:NADPH:quinone reductase-like Zn-dependent oxidoreductase|nr:NAD(P)-dependent alcohol dehydrogenase [Acidimicrobiales bacterium]
MPVEPKKMKAVIQEEYGVDPEEVLCISHVVQPPIDDDGVLVRVVSVSVDRGTWHLMSGLQYPIRLGIGLRRPKALNPGRSFAGTIEFIGQNVTDFKPGDHVFGTCDGAFAEYARTTTRKIAIKPSNLSFEQSAAIPVSGLTALQALRDKAHLQSGESVLIVGASGGVGTFAIQIAKAFGAEVTGVCSTSKTDLVSSLGADHVIDYSLQSFATVARRYDVIVDIGGVSRLSDLRRALTPRGRLVTVGGESTARWIWPTAGRQIRSLLISPFVGQKLLSLLASENSKDLSSLRDLVEAGDLRPAIDRTFRLGETSAAIRYVQEGYGRGKVVISV